MKLILGLGNIGDKYVLTRHNVGFMVLDYICQVEKEEFRYDKKLECFLFSKVNGGEKVFFVKPTTYVNLSGNALVKIINYYKIDIKDILVIQDDVSLDFLKIRIKNDSSDGGHNGIKSIINHLGSKKFMRIKIGVGMDERVALENFVLSKFNNEEIKSLNSIMEKIKKIIDMFIKGESFEKILTSNNKGKS